MGKKRPGKPRESRTARNKDPKISLEAVISQVEALAGPVCEAESLSLVYVEFQRETGGWVLRLYIDKPGGVTLDECANISRQLGDLLDVSLENIWPYYLQVSSPGIERPLWKMDDYEQFKGHWARIKTKAPIDGQKNYKGVLGGFSGDMILLRLEERTVAIPFQEIAKAKLA
ncbi:MAG: ribosome maturation factor RimP [Deltaproteobacteria bacterium]|nr:ribosome maturation factor RimP [Deltaproteobacteria bacterium]